MAGNISSLSIRENWVGLESNPEVMTEYAQKMGVTKGWSFTDVFGLDDESLKMVPSPCVGIIFLYPFSQVKARERRLGSSRGGPVQGVWFMDQTIGNACGAVALTHTVMNCMDRVTQDSAFLKKFRAEAKDADARQRGEIFGQSLRSLHDEVSARGQTEAPKPNADLDFHFVSLVPVNGKVYELDGNNEGPIEVGVLPDGDDSFLHAAVEHVKEAYIKPFPDSHFSMMALGPAQQAAGGGGDGGASSG